MKFNSVPDDSEKTSFPVWPVGEYDFETAEAVEGITQSGKNAGNQHIKLKLKVFNEIGKTQYIFTYLSNGSFMTRDALKLIGKTKEDDVEASDFENMSGKLKLRIDPAEGEYDEKNSVHYLIVPKDYKVPKKWDPNNPDVDPADILDDDLPF